MDFLECLFWENLTTIQKDQRLGKNMLWGNRPNREATWRKRNTSLAISVEVPDICVKKTSLTSSSVKSSDDFSIGQHLSVIAWESHRAEPKQLIKPWQVIKLFKVVCYTSMCNNENSRNLTKSWTERWHLFLLH